MWRSGACAARPNARSGHRLRPSDIPIWLRLKRGDLPAALCHTHTTESAVGSVGSATYQGERCKPVCKPDSVPAFPRVPGKPAPGGEVGGGRPSLWDAGCPAPHAVRPGTWDEQPLGAAMRRPSLFDLAPGGVYRAGRSPGRRWALTPPFHRCRRAAAVSFLWHSPSGHPDWALPSALLCGVRTFLRRRSRPRPSDRLAVPVYRRFLRFSWGRSSAVRLTRAPALPACR